MNDTFITKIHINKVRHLCDIDIDLCETERKHLILTGKNGSGKTSLLEAIRDFVIVRQRRLFSQLNTNMPYALQDALRGALYGNNTPDNSDLSLINIDFSQHPVNCANITFAYFPAERSDLTLPNAVEAIEDWGKTIITRNASKDFLKYIVNLYVQYLSEKDAGKNPTEIAQYKHWFDRFTQALRDIYACPDLELKPDMKKLEFCIVLPGHEPFGLHKMSDGYKAFIEILMELLMRFERTGGLVDYTESAIVIIDEIETHLHVELQKRALPFLTQMFPNVQFIVATHSPFVITSLSKAVVYDLEKQERLDHPSYYSYETIVESFLDTDMYSTEMKQQLERYKELYLKKRTPAENEEFLRVKAELELMAPASKELFIAFRSLEQQRKEAKYGQLD